MKRLKQLISEVRPLHVWISCQCSPYSPLQRISQRDEAQRERLKQKRREAVVQYEGGIQIARHACLCGAEVHFELAQRYEAWKLPFIEEFQQELRVQQVTCNG